MISIIIPFKNANTERERNINFVVSHYKSCLSECEIIVCEQDTNTHIDNIDHHLKFNFDNDSFRKAFLFNQGYNISNNKCLFFADADCVVNDSVLKNINSYCHLLDDHIILPYDGHVCYMNESETQAFISDNSLSCTQTRWASGGVIIINSDNFYRVGGFDERFKGWGAEDDAFFNKCLAYKLNVHRASSNMVHLYHPDVCQKYDNYANNLILYNKIFSEEKFKIYQSSESIKFNHLIKKK